MIITGSEIKMASGRRFQRTEAAYNGISLGGGTSQKSFVKEVFGLAKEGQGSFQGSLKNLVGSTGTAQQAAAPRADHDSRTESLAQIRFQLMNRILQTLFPPTRFYRGNLQFGQIGGAPFYTRGYLFQEEEATAFSTQGKVQTADGREISFNVDLLMSRSFTEAYEERISAGLPQFTDPLVVNLDSGSCEVTDQTFYFDLDADGHTEAIHQLSGGSGFLALDRNGDGIINDGTELFGSQSGDGFADLSQYDADGNGWIDEADPIFDHLVIWTKDPDGRDRLAGLGQAGVGAICLGSAATDFSLNDLSTNEAQAKVRRTGVFLYENGRAGTIQQVDFAS